MTPRRRQRGTGMIEFSLVAPLVLVVIFALIDLARAVEANTTVAEAARQGARQAIADAVSADSPFGTYNNKPCSGQVFTRNQTGTGCLTDAAIVEALVRAAASPACAGMWALTVIGPAPVAAWHALSPAPLVWLATRTAWRVALVTASR